MIGIAPCSDPKTSVSCGNATQGWSWQSDWKLAGAPSADPRVEGRNAA